MNYIWKKRLTGVIFMALAGLVFNTAAMSLPAAAAGESYSFSDTTGNTIAASGGAYATPATFAKATTSTAGVTFTSTASLTCGAQTPSVPLSLNIDSAAYAARSTSASVAASLTPPPAAAQCATLDTTLTIIPTSSTTAATASTTTAADTCDQGSFSWITCPFIDNLSTGISKLATTALTPLLKVNVITPTSAPQLYAVWANLRDLADAFFILIFFVIIFSTMTEQDFGKLDQYTVKKIWPYLVAAAILVQFSFLICGLLVDVGNVAGAGMNTLITSVIHPTKGAASATNVAGNISAIIAGIGIGTGAGLVALGSAATAIPLLLSLFLSIFVVFLTLGLRFLLIAVLIASAPLACIALVLPNTRHWFNDWLTFLFRLILMYPLIIGIISIAGIINEVLPFSADTSTNPAASFAILLMKIIIVIATFLLIPATFRFAGKGLDRAYGFMNGTAMQGKGALKSSEMWQHGKDERARRQNKYMGKVLDSKMVNYLGGKGRTGSLAAGAISSGAGFMFLGAPSNRRALEAKNSKHMRADKKILEDLTEAQNPGNLKKVLAAYSESDPSKRRAAISALQKTVPNLAQIGSNQSGREAIMSTLADRGLVGAEDLENFRTAARRRGLARLGVSGNVASEYPSLLGQTGKERSSKPFIATRLTAAKADYEVKDAAGNVVRTIGRDAGDLDLNYVALGVRKLNARDYGDKFALDNWDVLLDTTNPKANDQRRQSAREAATIVAQEADARELAKSFDPTNERSFAPLENRLKIARAFEANRDIFQVSPRGQEKYNTVIANLGNDHDLSYNLAELGAGVPQYVLDSLTPHAHANIARDWMRGQAYDSYHDYLRGGKT